VINDYAGLASVGIEFVDNDTVEDELDKDTLEIDTTTLDEALLNNPEDVRRLFAFDFTSSDNDVVLLGFSGKTTYAASGYTLNIGTFGTLHKDSAAITDQTALLNTASSFNATTSGSFTVNGALVTYDVTTDTLDSLVTKINDASTTAGNGVVATVIADSPTTVKLSLNSTQGAVTLAGDTGDLVAALNVTANTEKLDFANIGGAAPGTDNGTATVNGRTITVTSASGAEGLSLFYNGAGSESAITLDFTVGLSARLDALLGRFVDTLDGTIETEIDTLESQNETAQTRIDELDDRLVILRASLTARFIAMETAVTSMRQLLDSLQSQFEAFTSSNQ
jgi:flagellar capping protein FliD